MSRPQTWRRYINFVDTQEIGIDAELSRYAARFKMATAFNGVKFNGISVKSSDGYSVGLKVGLSYSALEALEKAIDKKVGRTQISDPLIPSQLRIYGKKTLYPKLISDLSNPKLKTNIEKFFENETDNLRYVAAGVRHLMFHGDFTAHGTGLANSKKLQRALTSLADKVLSESELNFSAWLEIFIDSHKK